MREGEERRRNRGTGEKKGAWALEEKGERPWGGP